MNKFLEELMGLADELNKATEGINCVIVIDSMDKLYDRHVAELKENHFAEFKNSVAGDFSKGYFCAVAALVKMYGDGTEAEQVLMCNFMSAAEMMKIGVDEGDIKVLKPIIKEIKRKQKLTK